jgi:hypothetical protein
VRLYHFKANTPKQPSQVPVRRHYRRLAGLPLHNRTVLAPANGHWVTAIRHEGVDVRQNKEHACREEEGCGLERGAALFYARTTKQWAGLSQKTSWAC